MARYRTSIILAPLILMLSACGGPSKADMAWLIDREYSGLTDIEVDSVRPGSGNWKIVTGRGVFAESYFARVRDVKLVSLCEMEDSPVSVAAIRSVLGERDVLAPVSEAGEPITFEIELAPTRPEAKHDPDRTSPGGWRSGAWGGGYETESGKGPFGRGKRRGLYSDETFEAAIFIDTPEFAQLCRQARARQG